MGYKIISVQQNYPIVIKIPAVPWYDFINRGSGTIQLPSRIEDVPKISLERGSGSAEMRKDGGLVFLAA